MLLHGRNLNLSLNNKTLLENASVIINSKDKIALLGSNGSGKTTLLKVIMGSIQPDSGAIETSNLRIASLLQNIPSFPNQTVRSVVANGLGDKAKLIARYLELTQNSNQTTNQELISLNNALEEHQAWELPHQLENILSRFNLAGDMLFDDLSGGLKRWTLLAQALISKPDLLLLDEPTNHLDIQLIKTLEQIMNSFHGTLLFVTHDRALIKNIATRIIELDRGYLTDWPGNYQHYLRAKEQLIQVEQKEEGRFNKKLQAEEIWIRKGIQARRTRNEGRVRSLKKMRQEQLSRRQQQKSGQLSWQKIEKGGQLVITAKNIYFAYDQKTIIKNFSCSVLRGDKIGIIGANGIGKSTLIKLLLGKITPTSGTITLGSRLNIAYIDQMRDQLNEQQTVRDNLTGGSDFIEFNQKKIHAIRFLNDFLFTAQQANSKVKALSGGERNRLLLAKLFAQPANLLILDEPTNDLDIETLELLEERCMDYPGTLLLISHDRCFLENTTTNIWELTRGGHLHEFVGGFPDWYNTNQELTKKTPPATKIIIPKKTNTKISYNEQRELKQLPKKIEALEAVEIKIQMQLADGDIYKNNPEKAAKLAKELSDTSLTLKKTYVRWEELEEKSKYK